MTVLPIIVSLIFNGIHNIGYSFGKLWISDEQGTLYTNFTIYILLIVIFLKEYQNEIRKDWQEVKEHIFSRVLLYGILFWIIGFVVANLDLLFGMSTTENQEKISTMYSASWILSSIIVCIAAPIIEEFVFRYIIMGYFQRKGKYIGIIVSSILFGIVHLDEISILAFIPYFVAGLYLGFVYYKVKSITTNCAIHSFYNLVNMLIALFLYLII